MKYTRNLLLGCTMLAVSATSHARQAEIKSFEARASRFQLLEPGFIREPVETTKPYASIGLENEFELLRPTPEPVSTRAGNLENLMVPSWMKAKSSSSERIGLHASTISLTSCRPLSYTPHPMLNAAQEMRRQRHFAQMVAAACAAGVPAELFDALIIQESRYNPLALSPKGASGLTQLMPGTARALGVSDRWSVAQNLAGGARYVRKQLNTFGNWALALGAYNAGPGNVAKYGGIPPFRETRGYVRAILTSIDAYQRSKGIGYESGIKPQRSATLASFNQ